MIKGVQVFPGRCTPIRAGESFREGDIEVVNGLTVVRTKDVHGNWFAEWCDPEASMRVQVEGGGDEAFVDDAISGLKVRDVQLEGRASDDPRSA